MNKNKTNLKANDRECLSLIFSEYLKEILIILYKHQESLQKDIIESKDDTVDPLLVFIDYGDTHDFDNYKIRENTKGLPFPYLPTMLFTNSDIREQYVKDIGTDFATICAVYYIKDLIIIKGLYDFLMANKTIGIDTNSVIYYLKQFKEELTSLYMNYVHKYNNAIVLEEIEEHEFDLSYISYEDIPEFAKHGDSTIKIVQNGVGIAIPTENISNIGQILDFFGINPSNICAGEYLGDLYGPVIGELVDKNTLFPYNVKKNGKIVSGIIWA